MLVCHEDFHTIIKCCLKGIWTAICLFFGIDNRLLQSYFKEHYYAETCTMPHFMLKPHPLKRLHLLSEVRNLRVLPMISPKSLGKLAMLGLLKMIYFNPGNWTWFDFGIHVQHTFFIKCSHEDLNSSLNKSPGGLNAHLNWRKLPMVHLGVCYQLEKLWRPSPTFYIGPPPQPATPRRGHWGHPRNCHKQSLFFT